MDAVSTVAMYACVPWDDRGAETTIRSPIQTHTHPRGSLAEDCNHLVLCPEGSAP